MYRLQNFCFTRYHGLIQAIPNLWRTGIFQSRDHILDEHENCISILQKTEKTSKVYYLKLLNLVAKKVKSSEEKWSLDERVHDLDWQNIYKLPFRSTKDTKIQEFQFLILRRLLWTNYNLEKAKVVASPRCSFCFDYSETIEHLLFECRTSHNLWLELIDTLNLKGIYPNFLYSLENIIFGILPCDESNESLNCIILLTKKFIYNCRCKNVIPVMHNLLNYLKFKINIEKMGLSEKGDMEKFNIKWNIFRLLLE